MVHPIERLRIVARADDAGPALLAQEAAAALAALADDPAGLVTACRRLVSRQPASAPMWWVGARVLAAGDPFAEACRCADELEDDVTPDHLCDLIPDDARACVIGWPELAAPVLSRRGDVSAWVIDTAEGALLVRRLTAHGGEALLVPARGVGAAASACDLVVLEPSAMGPDAFLAAPGSRAAAAVARHAGVPVWLVAGVGHVLPKPVWAELAARVTSPVSPWQADLEMCPLDLVDAVVGPAGLETVAEAVRRTTCPVVPELLKELS